MSTTYHAVHWNPQKRRYDLVLFVMVVLAAAIFISTSVIQHPAMTIETLLLRCSAFLCLFLIHLVLCIGPLARLSSRFLPLLYNRRHLGVCLFFLATFHGALALIQHHALGDTSPLVSLLTSYGHEYAAALASPMELRNIPFEPFGLLALLILFFMAATSHDFWLRLLGASLWKSLHLLVYLAYGLIVLHVAFGFLQSEVHVVYPALVFAASLLLLGLHLAAHLRDQVTAVPAPASPEKEGYVAACRTSDLKPGKGTVVRAGKRKVALFLHEGKAYALGNVCRHQGGPIGEGQLVDGCVTCPWHGWQYRPESGESPPPFNEHIPTYPLRIQDGMVFVKPDPNARGTEATGAFAAAFATADPGRGDFYIGYEKKTPDSLKEFLLTTASLLLLAGPLFMAAVAAAQTSPDTGHYEFGQYHTLEGVLYMSPVPTLYTLPDASNNTPGYHVLLCGTGKSGIPDSWSTYDGMRVSLTGSFIYRRDVVMLEVSPDAPPTSSGAADSGAERPRAEVVGPVTLAGELVDTKCYLGVMRPATGKVHRACAIRCLSGGVPPGLRVHYEGESTVIILAGPTQEALQYDVTWAGRKVLVEGLLERQDGFALIRVDDMSLLEPDWNPGRETADSDPLRQVGF